MSTGTSESGEHEQPDHFAASGVAQVPCQNDEHLTTDILSLLNCTLLEASMNLHVTCVNLSLPRRLDPTTNSEPTTQCHCNITRPTTKGLTAIDSVWTFGLWMRHVVEQEGSRRQLWSKRQKNQIRVREMGPEADMLKFKETLSQGN